MIRLITFLLLALLPGLAAAQRSNCSSSAPFSPACQALATNPQWSDIVFGIQVDASNRSDQTLRSGLDQLAGVPGAELRTPLHYGAVGDGNHDDTAAVQAAIAAAAGATLYLGPGLYKITAALTSAAPVRIIGSSGGGGIYSGTCTAGLRIATANINLLTLSAPGSRLENTCIDSSVMNTAGAAVTVPAGSNSTIITTNQINGSFIGIDITGSGGSQQVAGVAAYNTIRPSNSAGAAAIRIGALSTHGATVDTQLISNQIYCNNGAIGILLLDAGGTLHTNNTPYACRYGTKVIPGANQAVIWNYFNGTDVGDTSSVNDLLIDTAASSALVNGLQFTGSWTSSAIGGPSVVIQDTAGSNAVLGVHFDGHRTYMGGNNIGFDIKAGHQVTIDASTICSGAASSGTGVLIEGSASDTSVRHSTIGRCDHPQSGYLAIGVSVTQSGAFVGQIIGNDFSASTLPINYAPATGNASTAVIRDNIKVDNITAVVASAATIALAPNPMMTLTGTTTISTINGAWSGRQVMMVPTTAGGISFTTGGNICNALHAAANAPVIGQYDGGSGCWFLK